MPLGAGRGGALRSRVLGLDLRSQRQAGVTVLVFIDPSTGEEIDGTLEAVERRRRTAEREKQALLQRVSAAEQRANVADERARALEERLRALTAHAPPPECAP